MPKRSRVNGRPTGRPRPQRPPSPSPAPGARTVAAPPPAAALTEAEAEAERAAELEAQLVAQEKAAAAARAAAIAARTRRAGGRDYDPELVNQPLSVRAAHEYAYVARDVRRIALTASLMLLILFGLAFAINVAGVIRL